jgi:hypothetical protein
LGNVPLFTFLLLFLCYLNRLYGALCSDLFQVMRSAALGFYMSDTITLDLEYFRAGLFT